MDVPVIAIVDDDPSIRRSLHRLVQSAGYAVETFASAREFLDLADALLINRSAGSPAWENISLKPAQDKPVFSFSPPQYVTPELIAWLKHRLSLAA